MSVVVNEGPVVGFLELEANAVLAEGSDADEDLAWA